MEQDVWVYKRPGLVPNTSVTAGAGLGAFNWLGDIYIIVGAVLYRNGVSVYSSMDTTGGVYTYSISLGATPAMLLQNGVKAYSYTVAGGVVAIPITTTVTLTGTTSTGSAVIAMASTAGLFVNASVTGNYIPVGATIISINPNVSVTISSPATVKLPVVYSATSSGGATPITLTAMSPATATSTIVAGFPVYYCDASGNILSSVFTTVNAVLSASSITVNFSGGGSLAAGSLFVKIDQPTSTTQSLTFVNPGTQTAGFVKGSAYLDGTTYMLTPTSYVDGSAFNDLTQWPALNSIAAMSEPDAGVFISKQLTYIVAFKSYSVEMFYDAGALVGSPLASAPSLKVNIGCRHAGSVQLAAGSLCWIGQTREGSVQVMMMDGLKAIPISTPSIEKLLQNADYTVVYSWVARIGGHRFYGVTLKNSNLTLVYDLATKYWAQWTDPNGNYFPIVASTNNSSQQSLLLHETNGKLYQLSITTFVDDGQLFAVDIYTPNWDGGVRKKKVLTLLDFCGDQVPGSQLMVRCSDDDYQTWTNFRVVDMSIPRPFLSNCGTFRRRAYHIRHYEQSPMRLNALEMQVDVGEL
jgi:hypothetical protein